MAEKRAFSSLSNCAQIRGKIYINLPNFLIRCTNLLTGKNTRTLNAKKKNNKNIKINRIKNGNKNDKNNNNNAFEHLVHRYGVYNHYINLLRNSKTLTLRD